MVLSDESLERLSEFVRLRLGLHFPRERWRDLARGVEASCRDLGVETEACAKKLLGSGANRQYVEVLGRHLTVGETYFFREEAAFRALKTDFLPALLERRRREGRVLRLWSAACATGEEPYSLAILLRQMIPDLQDWRVTILATDVNIDSLRKAEAGIYGSWSFRSETEPFRSSWFVPDGQGRYQVRSEIRKMVTFAFHNLVEDPYPSLDNNTNAMDVIFCRNVLMYFAEEKRQQVLQNLQACLVEGGVLIPGTAESSLLPLQGLVPVALPDLLLYRKSSGTEKPAAVPSLPVSPRRPAIPPRTRKQAVRAVSLPPPPVAAASFEALKDLYRRGEYVSVCRMPELAPDHPDFVAASLLAARACANTGNLSDALARVDPVLKLRRFEPEAHYLRALILEEQGMQREALEALRTTLYLDIDFIPAYLALGNLFRRRGDRSQAERNYRNALLLLENYGDDEMVPHAEEMRAGRLREAVIAALGGENGTTKGH